MIKVIELFAGIGAIHNALKQLDIDFKVIDAVEYDKKVINAYNAIHNTNFAPCNVNEWNKNIECDYLHASTPCTAFSNAGKRLGADDPKNGFILWKSTLRIIKQTKPKIITLENVKGLLNKSNKDLVNWYIGELAKLGYKTEYKILNAKDFSIPQNRERVFFVSYKNDLDLDFSFDDLKNQKLIPLKNFLLNVSDVDDYYYIKQKSMLKALDQNKIRIVENIVSCITTKQWRWNNAGCVKIPFSSFNQENTINDATKAIVPTLTARGANSRIKIAFETTINETNTKYPVFEIDNKYYLLRILTEQECFRLMGFSDIDFLNAKKVSSKSTLYFVAGNSIVVNVVKELLKNVFKFNNVNKLLNYKNNF